MRQILFALCALVLFPGAGVRAQVVRPVLLQKVEAEFDLGGKPFFTDLATVTIILDARGTPYSFDSVTTLPHSVVQALSQWKFKPGTKDGKPVSFTIEAIIPIRRPLEQIPFLAARPSIPDGDTLRSAKRKGEELDWAKAAKLKARLNDDLRSLPDRVSLLVFASRQTGPEARQLHIEQLEWLVRNQPGIGLLGTSAALIFSPSGSPRGEQGYEEIKALWLDRLAERPNDAVDLGHATYFFRFAEPELAESLLLPAVSRYGAAGAWLGELYGYSALGVRSFESRSSRVLDAASALPATAFGQKARAALLSSEDPRVVMSALSTVTGAGRELAGNGKLPSGYAAFCADLLARAKALYPDSSESCDGSPLGPDAPYQEPRLLKNSPPVYPPEAKRRMIEGRVIFGAVVGKEGALRFLEFRRGPIALYDSARTSVSRWTFQPAVEGTAPIAATIWLEVNFELVPR